VLASVPSGSDFVNPDWIFFYLLFFILLTHEFISYFYISYSYSEVFTDQLGDASHQRTVAFATLKTFAERFVQVTNAFVGIRVHAHRIKIEF
jgi:hypothetical protein